MINKFQEALHRVCCSCDGYSMGACEHCVVYAPMKELIDEHEKYKWHDLRKDPDDLPSDDSITYLICIQYPNGARRTTLGSFFCNELDILLELEDRFRDGYKIIAWKHIEELKE